MKNLVLLSFIVVALSACCDTKTCPEAEKLQYVSIVGYTPASLDYITLYRYTANGKFNELLGTYIYPLEGREEEGITKYYLPYGINVYNDYIIKINNDEYKLQNFTFKELKCRSCVFNSYDTYYTVVNTYTINQELKALRYNSTIEIAK